MGNGVHESVSTQVRVPSDGDRREPQRPGLCQSPPCERLPKRERSGRRGLPRGLGAGLSGWSR